MQDQHRPRPDDQQEQWQIDVAALNARRLASVLTERPSTLDAACRLLGLPKPITRDKLKQPGWHARGVTLDAATGAITYRDPPRPPTRATQAAKPDAAPFSPEINARLRMKELNRLHGALARAGLPTVEVDAAIANGGEAASNGEALGGLIRFSFDQYKLYGKTYGRHPRTIRPFGVNKHDLKAYLRTFHAPARAAREKARRDATAKRRAEDAVRVKSAADLDMRGEAIFAMLLFPDWQLLVYLMTALEGSKAFRRADRRRLTGNSLRVAILRELEKQPLKRMIETKDEKGNNGRARTLVRRRPGGLFGHKTL